MIQSKLSRIRNVPTLTPVLPNFVLVILFSDLKTACGIVYWGDTGIPVQSPLQVLQHRALASSFFWIITSLRI